METHETLVHLAKTFGLLWMMGFFLLVVWYAFWPGFRARHERAGKSVLSDDLMAEDRA
ncbi:cbb3-type cytochrome c oxidase subunit 3 [Paracoccus sp. (in: a-proteobacteria)]|uniref:cbb3-type cytochrome c oxidase subunit 3 n=1 Tax=Paracoccus sp. TaxID=267 RepID=UPI0032205840